jgi:hypothetical protein
MGVLTELVLAHLSDAEKVAHSAEPAHQFGGLEANGISIVTLGCLHSILKAVPYSNDPTAGYMTGKSLLFSESDDGPWVYLVPPELTLLASGMKAEDMRSVAVELSESRIAGGLWGNSPEGFEEFLPGFAELAKGAIGEGKSILMWVCP